MIFQPEGRLLQVSTVYIILVKYIPYQFDLQKYIPYQFDLLKGTVLMLYRCSEHVLSKNCKILLQPNCRLNLPGTILQVRNPILECNFDHGQGCGNTMPDLSDMVPFHPLFLFTCPWTSTNVLS